MKNLLKIILLSCVLVLLDCGEGNQTPLQTLATSCAISDSPPPGLVCDKNRLVWVVMSAGMCQTNADCVPPYQTCNTGTHQCQSPTIARCLSDADCPTTLPTCDTTTYRCKLGSSVVVSPQTWFVTDKIRPAATVDCVDKDHCAALNRYVYNIMAKGYNSLEDWCLAQAQQSNLPTMREINSWRALIAAPPDSGYSSPSYQLLLTLADFNLLLTTPLAKYHSPGDTSTFSKSHAQIADKNGRVSFFKENSDYQNPTYGVWTGMAVLQTFLDRIDIFPSSCPFFGNSGSQQWSRCPVLNSLNIGTGVGNIDVTSNVLGEQFTYSSTSPRWTASRNAWSTVYDPVFTTATDTLNNPDIITNYYHSFAGILILTSNTEISSPFYFVTATASLLPSCDYEVNILHSRNCPCYDPTTFAQKQIYVPTGGFPSCQVPDKYHPYVGPGIKYYANATTTQAYPIICLANQNNQGS